MSRRQLQISTATLARNLRFYSGVWLGLGLAAFWLPQERTDDQIQQFWRDGHEPKQRNASW